MLVAVQVADVQALNYQAVQRNVSRPLPARWTPVRAGNVARGFGPSVGILDPSCQSCEGQTVIPPYCPPPPLPTEEQAQNAQAMKQAIVDALRDAPPIVVQPSPIQSPGYRGERRLITNTIAINGSGAGAVAAGAALMAAAGGVVGAAGLGITNQLVGNTPATFGALQTYVVPSSKTAQIASLSFSSNSIGAATTLFFSVWRSGRIVCQEFQFTSRDEVLLEFPANGDDTVVVMCRNPDTTGAWLVTLGLELWLYPTVNRTDGLNGKVLRQDPGLPNPLGREMCERPASMRAGRN